MKNIFTTLLIITLTTSYSKAEVPSGPKSISVLIRQEWSLNVTESGIVSLHSFLDAHPLSGAHTSAGVVSYEEIKQDILKQAIIPPTESSDTEKSITVTIPGNSDKRAITESTLYKILSQASGKWKFPGLNGRILELLNRKPILKNIEEQNKALHLTEGAVVPK